MNAADVFNIQVHASHLRSHADRIIRACVEVQQERTLPSIKAVEHRDLTHLIYIVQQVQLAEIELASLRASLPRGT